MHGAGRGNNATRHFRLKLGAWMTPVRPALLLPILKQLAPMPEFSSTVVLHFLLYLYDELRQPSNSRILHIAAAKHWHPGPHNPNTSLVAGRLELHHFPRLQLQKRPTIQCMKLRKLSQWIT